MHLGSDEEEEEEEDDEVEEKSDDDMDEDDRIQTNTEETDIFRLPGTEESEKEGE